MTIELNPEQQRVIELAVESGAYDSADEVIATALSILADDIEDGPYRSREDMSRAPRWPRRKRNCGRSAS